MNTAASTAEGEPQLAIDDPRVAAFLDQGLRTGPALAPKIYLGMLVLGCVIPPIATAAMGRLAGLTWLLAMMAVAVTIVFALRFIVFANRQRIRPLLGRPRPWSALESIEAKQRTVTHRDAASRAHKRSVYEEFLHFRGAPTLKLNSEWEQGGEDLVLYAKVMLAMNTGTPIPASALPAIERATGAKRSFIIPAAAIAGVGVISFAAALFATVGSMQEAARVERIEAWRAQREVDTAQAEVAALTEAAAAETERLEAPVPFARARDRQIRERAEALGYTLGATAMGHEHTTRTFTLTRTTDGGEESHEVTLLLFQYFRPEGHAAYKYCRVLAQHAVCVGGGGRTSSVLSAAGSSADVNDIRASFREAGARLRGRTQSETGELVDTSRFEMRMNDRDFNVFVYSWARSVAGPDVAVARSGNRAIAVRTTAAGGTTPQALIEQLVSM